MIDESLDQGTGVSNITNPSENTNSQRMLSQDHVNDILAARLAKQRDHYEKRIEEIEGKIKSSIPDESAIAARVRQELEIQYQKSAQEEEQRRYMTQFEIDKNQYKSKVKDVSLPPEEDELGLFDPKNEQKYLPLQIVAGNLNMEDTAEIMKELARNPRKLRELNIAAKDCDWDYVKSAFKRISKSIKENESGINERSRAKQPLNHLKPSAGGSSNREASLDDLRRDRSLYF